MAAVLFHRHAHGVPARQPTWNELLRRQPRLRLQPADSGDAERPFRGQLCGNLNDTRIQ
ncbi:UNVERIFIED_CONTAM: hypothetical protein Sangu_3120500 [Sesamum angustifolium]|uniref:Uncharacterized protein n=1 Tax=Sesamum angustifolium TaxID=2727405 RepID=A0AAW2K1D6_9LAMI